MISQDEAIAVAKKHHGEGFEFFKITRGIPNNCRIYGSGDWVPDNVWCVLCSAHPNNHYILASSRAIVIFKDTGKILYDGSANDEG